jgi:putative ubiquitin-RnfH superfamily antitoxin RatB of RatAB toxin-antitoxin module
VFGKRRPADTVVADGDRIEIYRPLSADPKEARRARARKSRAAKR